MIYGSAAGLIHHYLVQLDEPGVKPRRSAMHTAWHLSVLTRVFNGVTHRPM